MAKSSKLRNVHALQQLLAGEHRLQTKKSVVVSGISDADARGLDRKYKEIGDTWFEYDANGNVERVVTKKGIDTYYVRSMSIYEEEEDPLKGRYFHNLRMGFPKCPKENCTCISPGAADKTLGKKTGMCLDCTVEYETKLKISGKFNEYANDKMRDNTESFIRDAEIEVQRIKDTIKSGISYVGENGELETWSSDGDHETEMLGRIDADWAKLKEELLSNYVTKEDQRENSTEK